MKYDNETWVETGIYLRKTHSKTYYVARATANKGSQILRQRFSTLAEAQEAYKNFRDKYPQSNQKFFHNLKGQWFGQLHVGDRVKNGKWGVTYHCECKCGNEIDVLAASLVNGNTTTCGGSAHNQEKVKTIVAETKRRVKKYQTRPEMLTTKKPITNTSGYKGVSTLNRPNGVKKYQAFLGLKKQKYRGQLCDTPEEAYQERLEMEKKYFEPVLQEFNADQKAEKAEDES